MYLKNIEIKDYLKNKAQELSYCVNQSESSHSSSS